MAKKACKCDPHEICEECPEWIFTLADLIMCMMGLFVILWVLKPSPKPDQGEVPNQEMIKVAAAIREALGYVPDAGSTDPVDIELLKKQLQRLSGPGEKGNTRHEPPGAEGTDPEVTKIREGKQAAVGGRILFEQNSDKIGRESIAPLDDIVKLIKGYRLVVMVKGHTSLDDLPENTAPEQLLDLSIRRANAVAKYLISKGVSPDIIRVQGCSTFEPVLQRAYTTAMQSNNRRVEVEATSTRVEELQGAPKAPLSPSKTVE